jgi:hypothetical protein
MDILYGFICSFQTDFEELWAWVEFFVDGAEAILVDVGVNLRRGDIDVAEHFLDAS